MDPMAYSRRRHSRVFFDIAAEYPAVYADDHAFASWVRLLMVADGLWPAPAILPRSVNEDSLQTLVTAGLVKVDGDHFEVKGLHKMRQAEHDQQSANANKRWHDGGNAGADAAAYATSMPSKQAMSTLPEGALSRSTVEEDHVNGNSGVEAIPDEWSALSALMETLTGRAYALPNPWSKMSEHAFELIRRHGWAKFENAVRHSAQQIGANPGVDELIFGAGKLLRRGVETGHAEKVERQAEQDTSNRRAVEQTQLALHYQHVEPKEHPLCPACREVAS